MVGLISILVVFVVAGIYVFGRRSATEKHEPKIYLITDENRDTIGLEEYGGYEIVEHDSGCLKWTDGGGKEKFPIPDNDIVFSTEDDTVFPGSSITEVETNAGMTPEFIGENGAVVIFTQENGEGWDCKPGTKMTWTFEKYSNQKNTNQAIAIGYIKDGVMYKPQVYQDALKGEYEVKIQESGTIYVYAMCMASDPIAVKAGTIEIK